MQSSREQIDRILAGDLGAYREFIESYERLVCHIVFRMVQNEADREEIAQEVFVRIYQNLGRFQFKSKISTWVGRIAYNVTLNYLKKKKVGLFDDIADVQSRSAQSGTGVTINDVAAPQRLEDDMDRTNMNDFVQQEIAHLPSRYRAILTLYHMDDMSYADIGEIMDLPEGTVKSYLFRARRMLKEKLLRRYTAEELCA